MIPGLPLTLGFTPDTALIDYLVGEIRRRHINPSIAESIIRQLLYSVIDDFAHQLLAGLVVEIPELENTYTACYTTYRPSNCRCFSTDHIFFEVVFNSKDLINYDIVHVEIGDASLLEIIPERAFFPTPEERIWHLENHI